jgi:ADP-heptose:LPS heptosyltransferase
MRKIIVYAQGRDEHAKAAAAALAVEHPGAEITVVSKDEKRAYGEKATVRPDLFVIVITNEHAYLKPLDIIHAFITMLASRPKEKRVLLYAWSGVYRLGDKLAEASSRALGFAVRPFYLAGVRLVHAAGETFRKKHTFESSEVRKALVISLDLVGDLVWAAPAITAIKKGLPHARVELLVHPSNVALARMIEGVDDVIAYDAPWLDRVHHPGGGPRKISRRENLATRIRLARAGYDLTVEFRGEPRDHVLSYTTGARFRAGLAGKAAGVIRPEDTERLLTHKVEDKAAFNEKAIHVLDRNMLVVGSLGIPAYRPGPWLTVDGEVRDGVRGLLAQFGVGGKGPLVGIQPGASRAEKRWPAERFAQVARALMDGIGAEVVVAGSAGEAALGEYIASNAKGAKNLCGMTDLPDFAALVGLCDLFIANETSAISIASATGTPVVCLMTGVPELYGPYGVRCKVLQKRPECYSPVGEHCFCAYGYRCLKDITTDEVVEAARQALASAGA